MTSPVPGRLTVPGGMIETAWWNQGAAGPTLVLLHEGLGSVGLWRDVPATLAAWTGFPVFAYSRLGYGRSDRAPPPWPPSYMHDEARDRLPAVLRGAGIGRHVLIGHSDGGSIAAIRAGTTDEPNLFGLVLIAAHFFVEDMNLEAICAIAHTYRASDLRVRLGRHHDHVDDAFDGWSGAWLDPAFHAFDLRPLLPAIRVPTLAVQGADDPYGSPAQLAALEDHMRVRMETRLIAGARHAPHFEAARETLAAITGFLLDLPTQPLNEDQAHA